MKLKESRSTYTAPDADIWDIACEMGYVISDSDVDTDGIRDGGDISDGDMSTWY